MKYDLVEITSDQIIGLNQKIRGIKDQPRDSSGLISCLGGIFYQSLNGYYHIPIEKMAGMLLYRLAQGQYFLDGNKRTALLSTVYFLGNNGYSLKIDREETNRLMWGFAPPNPKYLEKDSISFIFKRIKIR